VPHNNENLAAPFLAPDRQLLSRPSLPMASIKKKEINAYR